MNAVNDFSINLDQIPQPGESKAEIKVEMRAIGKQAELTTLAKYQIEQELQSTIEEIRKDIDKQFELKNIAYLTACELLQEFKSHHWTTASKVAAIAFSLSTLYPLVVGAIACLNSFRLVSVADLFSSDLTVANLASQLHANTGHSVGYLWEGLGINAVAMTLLVRHSYRKVAGKIIDKVYRTHIENAFLSQEKSDFLYDMRQQELAQYGLHSSQFARK
jgi:hypothetical protein